MLPKRKIFLPAWWDKWGNFPQTQSLQKSTKLFSEYPLTVRVTDSNKFEICAWWNKRQRCGKGHGQWLGGRVVASGLPVAHPWAQTMQYGAMYFMLLTHSELHGFQATKQLPVVKCIFKGLDLKPIGVAWSKTTEVDSCCGRCCITDTADRLCGWCVNDLVLIAREIITGLVVWGCPWKPNTTCGLDTCLYISHWQRLWNKPQYSQCTSFLHCPSYRKHWSWWMVLQASHSPYIERLLAPALSLFSSSTKAGTQRLTAH